MTNRPKCIQPRTNLSTVERLLTFVTDKPESATAIWRRFAGVEPYKTLTSRRRRQRQQTAALLEDMAADGLVVRGEGDANGHPVPVYSRA